MAAREHDWFAANGRASATDERRHRRCHRHGSSPVTLRAVAERDIKDVVCLHEAAFPGFTMTRLGPRFLAAYYRTLVSYSQRVFIVAENAHGRAIGFVAGFANPAKFYQILRSRRPTLAWAALPYFARDPRLIMEVRGGSQWALDQAGSGHGNACELASIGVDPAHEGQGLGSELVRLFMTEAAAMGTQYVTLTTDAINNERVRRFYQRLGFKEGRTLDRGSARPMIEYRIYLESEGG